MFRTSHQEIDTAEPMHVCHYRSCCPEGPKSAWSLVRGQSPTFSNPLLTVSLGHFAQTSLPWEYFTELILNTVYRHLVATIIQEIVLLAITPYWITIKELLDRGHYCHYCYKGPYTIAIKSDLSLGFKVSWAGTVFSY